MRLFSLTLLIYSFSVTTSIYSFNISSADGGNINFSTFEGKKILLVNIATGSDKVSQLAELQQLHQQYGDNLVVIGFPSNSFGNESRSNAEIKSFCQSQHGITFLLAAKGDVKGSSIQPVYNWLTKESENGQANTIVKDDFQKYLISESGELIGIFIGSVSPLDQQIVSNITGSSN